MSHGDDLEAIKSLGRRELSQRSHENLLTCRDCHKKFRRPCDLTKHEKSHSRPWKCHEEKCKYHDLGWPTEKERDRHVADKHSSEPTQFKCLYPPCTYASKRESNCKQHMEKAHGWEYVRSKSNGRKKTNHTDHTTSLSAPLSCISSSTTISPVFSDVSSVTICAETSNVSPDDSWQFDEGFADGDPASPNNNKHYTVWSGPLESASLFESTTEQQEFALFNFEPSALDYTLFEPLVTPEFKEAGKAEASHKEPELSKVPRTESALRIDSEPRIDPRADSSKESGKVAALSATGLDPTPCEEPGEVASLIPGSTRPSPTPDELESPLKSTKRSIEIDTKGCETTRPPKRVKKCTPKRGKLRLMSCIYRKHKPETYNYKDTKFKTCHTTSHEYISTLVRHLERYHNAVLCHTCLSAFKDVRDKDKHKETTKCKAAYGCQEDKWQMLYRTLCGDDNKHSPYFECSSEQPPPMAPGETQQSSQGIPPEDKAEPSMTQSPTHLYASVSSGQSVAPSTPVSLNNTEREELERLREENNRLLRENNALLRRVLQWESICANIDTSIAPMPAAI